MKRSHGRTATLFVAGMGLGMVLLSGTALAVETEPMGMIEARIDGEEERWETLDVPSEDAATATYRVDGSTTTIAIQGHDPEADSMLKNVLNLEVTIMGEDTEAATEEVSVNLFPDGLDNPFYVSDAEGAEANIIWDHLELGDGTGHAKGSFTARLCRREGIVAEPDPENCREVEGRFSTELRALEQ